MTVTFSGCAHTWPIRLAVLSPTLPDLITVVGGGAAVVAAALYLFAARDITRQTLERIALAGALGGLAGTAIAFAIYLGIIVGSA